eukprot:TRINITY_DN2635_c0_g1_i10.p1 TRINITY_DN2635_c0_g1~~TRINITY_DN2635_c0_g1_i10.p1  ORF type:complete len:186 (+),score=28.69 TRINITY_DN2635_c0_g1_i10:305-862(+)
MTRENLNMETLEYVSIVGLSWGALGLGLPFARGLCSCYLGGSAFVALLIGYIAIVVFGRVAEERRAVLARLCFPLLVAQLSVGVAAAVCLVRAATTECSFALDELHVFDSAGFVVKQYKIPPTSLTGALGAVTQSSDAGIGWGVYVMCVVNALGVLPAVYYYFAFAAQKAGSPDQAQPSKTPLPC